MTNEEAINVLQNTIVRFGRSNGKTVYAEALDMAIEALSNFQKQADSEVKTTANCVSEADVIYRQQAIDAIEELDWYHQNRNKDMVSGANSAEHQAWYKADDVYKALESVPSAQPVFIELCSAELTCEGCKYEKTSHDLCGSCCRGYGDMYEERKDNG